VAEEGLAVFKNNCLFCHSLKGRGGNKGVRVLEMYDFSSIADRKEFLRDFKKFHHKNNPDKQDVEQFVTPEKLKRVVGYLLQVQNSK
jgi:cytochrome c